MQVNFSTSHFPGITGLDRRFLFLPRLADAYKTAVWMGEDICDFGSAKLWGDTVSEAFRTVSQGGLGILAHGETSMGLHFHGRFTQCKFQGSKREGLQKSQVEVDSVFMECWLFDPCLLSLTGRQIDVLALLAQGMDPARVADALSITENAVYLRMNRSLKKSQFDEIAGLVATVQSSGLLEHHLSDCWKPSGFKVK